MLLERKCTSQEPGRENPGAWLQGIRQKHQGQNISLHKKRDSVLAGRFFDLVKTLYGSFVNSSGTVFVDEE